MDRYAVAAGRGRPDRTGPPRAARTHAAGGGEGDTRGRGNGPSARSADRHRAAAHHAGKQHGPFVEPLSGPGARCPGAQFSAAARCPGRQAHAPAKGVGPDPGPQIAFGERKGVATNTLRREEGGRRRFRTTRPPKRERRLRPPKSGRVGRHPGNRAADPAAANRRAAPASEKRKGSPATGEPGSGPGRRKQKGCSGRPNTKRNKQTRNAIKSNTTKWQKKHR